MQSILHVGRLIVLGVDRYLRHHLMAPGGHRIEGSLLLLRGPCSIRKVNQSTLLSLVVSCKRGALPKSVGVTTVHEFA